MSERIITTHVTTKRIKGDSFCHLCGNRISMGDTYFVETVLDKNSNKPSFDIKTHATCDWIIHEIPDYFGLKEGTDYIDKKTFLKGIGRFCKTYTECKPTTNTKYKLKIIANMLEKGLY